ncbi:hypothetical protein Y032_0670g1372 [Ancylostoma ceylanicum]|uniref:Uncharacterized protein n=1 Tax=Ancylostoma ceylanicum TaxID=53326 RepID=A0A016WH96_9BILA|nr:hypothetical protein Y032_0670g1372 [Ancylostoma ceylanicum]
MGSSENAAQGSVPKYSKESTTNPPLRQLSKEGSEEGSVQMKLRKLASWKSLTKLQKTQQETPEEAVLPDPLDAKRAPRSTPKYSKESSAYLSLRKHSKDGSEDGSSKPRKLRMLKSWKGFSRSQKTQPEIQEESDVTPDAQGTFS